MDDACRVGAAEGLGDLDRDGQSIVDGQGAFAGEPVGQCPPFEVGHDDEGVALSLSDLMDALRLRGELPRHRALIGIEPADITLELDRLISVNLPIQPSLEGVPAPGFTTGEVRTSPIRVNVQGPESTLADLEFVETTPVSVEGATGPVEATVLPSLTDPMLRSLTVVPIVVRVDVVPLETTPTPAGGGS